MSRGAAGIARQGTKLLARGFDAVSPPDPGLAILIYHRVGNSTTLELELDPAEFGDQMQWIAESGLATSLEEGLERLTDDEATASVAVTFDDGTMDFSDHALQALVDANVPATYYISTAFVEEQREFPDGGVPLSWAALRDAVATGLVTVGSHTHTHAVMDKLTPAEARNELTRSKELIEDHLGVPANHFAHPKGVAGSAEVEREVERLFDSAALADGSVNVAGKTDMHRLDRIPVQRSDGMANFQRKAMGGLRLEGMIRAEINKRRYRAATS